MIEKGVIRSTIRDSILAMSATERAREEARIAKAITAFEPWRQARSLLIYQALPDEVSLSELASDAIRAGKRLYLPRVAGESLAFAAYEPARTELQRHALGMDEPTDSGPDACFDPSSGPWMVICPGRAFSRRGERLGRGGGYYDRFLVSPAVRNHRPIAVIGVCYEVQLRYSLPCEDHDVPMDFVVTGAGEVFGEHKGPLAHSTD
ncbi:MAG: 5-formyltetrahydrofolate cyclo-ligase [Spirochaetales bacterium]